MRQKQTSCPLFSVVSKTCKQAVTHVQLTKPALEKTCILSTRSSAISAILSEFLAAQKKAKSISLWWACLDSNQEPDRYERPALTIELQAPPRAAAFAGQQR